jgi:L-ribulose-5-phosphate 4-epimerase
VVVDLEGRVVEGRLRPSSDLPTHLALYRAFPQIGGVAHTHSRCATAWAQAGRDIPCLGTSHGDYFHGPIPVTAALSAQEIAGDYEANTGAAIVRRFVGLDPLEMQAALVLYHGPFTWGRSAAEAAYHAVMLEEVARMALDTLVLQPSVAGLPQALLDRHFYRKHGAAAYYGQSEAKHD